MLGTDYQAIFFGLFVYIQIGSGSCKIRLTDMIFFSLKGRIEYNLTSSRRLKHTLDRHDYTQQWLIKVSII